MLFLKQKLSNVCQKYLKNENSMLNYFTYGFLISYPQFKKLKTESLKIYFKNGSPYGFV